MFIPDGDEVIFERFSDSAAAFVTLDPNNISVYKQLYRAAKAKLKLRLKATVVENASSVAPLPASVEDEDPIEEESRGDILEDEHLDSRRYQAPPTPPTEVPVAVSTNSLDLPTLEPVTSPSVAQIQRGLEDLLINRAANTNTSRTQPKPRQTQLDEIWASWSTSPRTTNASVEIPVTRGAAAREKWFTEHFPKASARKAVPEPQPMPVVPAFSVYCNECNDPIPNAHYHCDKCDDGDYDLCESCVDAGRVCDGGHWMVKRTVKDGKFITSTTTIAPRKVPTNDSKATLVDVEKNLPNYDEMVDSIWPMYRQAQSISAQVQEVDDVGGYVSTRTCNSCIEGMLKTSMTYGPQY